MNPKSYEKKTLKAVAVVLACFLFANVNGQTTITLQPGSKVGKDAYLWSIEPNSNFGDHPDILATEWTHDGDLDTVRSIFKFNLTSIPSDATIQKATLSLYWSSDPTNNGHAGLDVSYLQRITTPWKENTVTWNTKPSTTSKNQVVIPQSHSFTQDYPDIDVTQLVKDMIAYGNHGFLMRLKNEVPYSALKFSSSDDADSSKHPKLVITYTEGSQQLQANNAGINPCVVVFNSDIGKIMITTKDGLTQIVSAQLSDLSGRLIKVQQFSQGNISFTTTFDVNDLPAGMYILSLLGINNQIVQTEKFIRN